MVGAADSLPRDTKHYVERLRQLKSMLRLRTFESALMRQPKPGFQLLPRGEEAIAVGICAALDRTDALLCSGPTEGPEAQLGEDLRVALALKQRGRFGYPARMPYLFVYVSHGHNSRHDGHHRMLASTLSISQGLLLRRGAEILAGLKFFDFGPGEVGVQGSNGLAFRL
jgi:hypothetical protein